MNLKGRVLLIASSDSGGGAGLEGDLKTATALGAYAMTATAGLTAQNTEGVTQIHETPDAFIAEQISLVLNDIGADAVKTGAMVSAAKVRIVGEALAAHAPDASLVIDPVMVATSGARLAAEDACAALTAVLFPRATVVTPNVPEAEALTGRPIASVEDMADAARALLELGSQAVLLKGGHLMGDTLTDVLVTRDGAETFAADRIKSEDTHGTGCATATAIAAGLAQGLSVRAAVERARVFVREAIRTAPGLGAGPGPMNHAHTVRVS